MSDKKEGELDRREVVTAILSQRKDALVVTGLGSSCYDVGVHDHPNTFYLWGAIGHGYPYLAIDLSRHHGPRI